MSLTQSLLAEFGPDLQSLTIVPLGGGVFEVRIGDELVFSRAREGRFPSDAEIAEKVRDRLRA